MNAERVVVATVSENRDPYRRETIALFRSLRLLGGEMSHARALAYFINSVSEEARRTLSSLDVDLVVVPPVDPDRPYLNKLRMFEDATDAEYLVALDNDIAVAGDFSAFVSGAAIAAKPVDQDPLTVKEWEELYSFAGLILPAVRFHTTFGFKETVAYFNSGVLILPGRCAAPLHSAWVRQVDVVSSAAENIPGIAAHIFFLDQFALSLAIADIGLPFRALPLEMNFPTHYPIHPAALPDLVDPLILHHHHRSSEAGGLLSTPYEATNRAIRRVNEICSVPVE